MRSLVPVPPFLQQALGERAAVVRMDVIALSPGVTTRTSVGPATLERLATHRTTTAERTTIDEAVRLLADSGPVEENGNIDARYGVAFIDARDRRILAFYLDKFGNRGVIEGRDVRLHGGRLVAWLTEMFPKQ